MGCFSFLCVNSGKAALSTSFDGSPCRLFLMREGEIVEQMHGNYDSYGKVFNGEGESFEWEMPWSDVCSLMFSADCRSGIAMILDEHWDGNPPCFTSENDPNQGWGSGEGEDNVDLIGNCSDDMFLKVENPSHTTHYDEPIDPLNHLDKKVKNITIMKQMAMSDMNRAKDRLEYYQGALRDYERQVECFDRMIAEVDEL